MFYSEDFQPDKVLKGLGSSKLIKGYQKYQENLRALI